MSKRPPHPNPIYISAVLYAMLEKRGEDMHPYKIVGLIPVSGNVGTLYHDEPGQDRPFYRRLGFQSKPKRNRKK